MAAPTTPPTRRAADAVLTVVAPVFNETEVIEQFCRRCLDATGPAVGSVVLLLVDDGSTDGSLDACRRIAEADPRVRVLSLSRNFGHQAAITAGMDHAGGDCVVVIDSDLQDPPEVIPQLLAQWEAGADVVHAVRTDREGETRTKRFLADAFYRTLQRLTDIDLTRDAGDFRLFDRRVADVLAAMPERQRFVRGLASWVGFRQAVVPYRREPRAAGTSKYPLRRSLRLALTAITSFSFVPLQLASGLGFLLSAVSALLIPLLIVLRLLGVAGLGSQTTVLVTVLFLGGIQLLFLGMIGEYLGRTSEEVKRRPVYLVGYDSAAADGLPPDPMRRV
jgi:glycosyltransferase involved in cell wall biosynthesis